jgi:hypothetical protein
MQSEEVTDPVNVDAMKTEAGVFRMGHPPKPVGASPLPEFAAAQMKLRILAEAVLARHRAAQVMMQK